MRMRPSGSAEHLGQLDAHGVGVLGGRPHGEAARLVPGGDGRVRLHGVVLDAREAIDVLHDEVGLGKGGGGPSALEVELVAHVGAGDGSERREVGEVPGQRLARVHQRRAGRQRLLQGGDGREVLVLDLDEVDAPRPRPPRSRRPRRPPARPRSGPRRWPGWGGRETRGRSTGSHQPRSALVATTCTPASGPGAGGVHAGDARVGIRRAKQLDVEHARQREVRHVARAAGDLLGGVAARRTERPTTRSGAGLRAGPPRRPARRAARLGGRPAQACDGVDDLAIAGAAAEVAAQESRCARASAPAPRRAAPWRSGACPPCRSRTARRRAR